MAQLQEIKVPLLSVNDPGVTVVEVLFSNGDHVKQNQIIMVFETSKTTYDVVAEADGYIQYLCETGHEYDLNEIVAIIFSEPSDVEKNILSQPAVSEKIVQQNPFTTDLWQGDTLFSSAATLLIESSGISKSKFKGKDFVTKSDVEESLGLNGKGVGKTPKYSDKRVLQELTQAQDAGKITIEKLSSTKKKEIAYLAEIQSTGLTSTVNTTIETGGIFVHINQSLKFLKNSLLPVIIYETGRLLIKYKKLNAYFAAGDIALYNEVNIGFAIDIDKGLKVIKIANTSEKTINEIEEEIMSLSGKYLDDALQVDDLTGITFIITDLSSEDVTFFTPLVNVMNSAILGISSIDTKLNRCILSVTFDHRVTEGKTVARFLKDLKDRMQSYQSKSHPNFNKNINCFKCYKSLSEDLSDVGFAKCITPEGEEGFICQSCLKGF